MLLKYGVGGIKAPTGAASFAAVFSFPRFA